MITPELISYIKSERAKGIDDKTIKSNIVLRGWDAGDFEEAVLSIAGISKKASEQLTPEVLKYRRDKKWFVFVVVSLIPLMYVIAMIGMYPQSFSTFLSSFGLMAPIYIVVVEGSIYLASRIATASMRPQQTKGKEIFAVVGAVIIAAILSGIIFIGLFFVTCLLLMTATGF